MKREYDIINELGRRNWLDATAGEALILGYYTRDIELEMMGTALAEKLGEVRYDSDEFFKVEAQASDLQRNISKKKEEEKLVLFIDEICEYDGGKKSLYKWEYGLVLADGKYVITMMMPEYQGSLPRTENREIIEEIVRNSYINPSFKDLKVVEDQKIVGHQRRDTAMHYTKDGSLICRSIDFQHEDGPKRGRYIKYFFDEYQQAMEIWVEIRSISSQKR